MMDTTFIFVIGAPRSGTTWLHKMIAEHPDIYSLNGSNTFLQGYIFPLLEKYKNEKRVFTERDFTRGLPSKLNEEEWEKIIHDFIHRFYSVIPDNFKYYVEKATDLTSEIGNIKKFIPNSKFIHIIRDGRNASISEVKLRKKYGSPFGIEDIYQGAIKWKKQIEEARLNAKDFENDVLEIKYEDLFKDRKLYLKRIFNHIGLDDNETIINSINNKFNYKSNPVSMPTTKITGKNGELFNTYMAEMDKTKQALFEYLAGDLLKALGYPVKNYANKKLVKMYIKRIYIPTYKFAKLNASLKKSIFKKLKYILID
jgi:hypothetical protein